jgi:hypothetical protein
VHVCGYIFFFFVLSRGPRLVLNRSFFATPFLVEFFCVFLRVLVKLCCVSCSRLTSFHFAFVLFKKKSVFALARRLQRWRPDSAALLRRARSWREREMEHWK